MNIYIGRKACSNLFLTPPPNEPTDPYDQLEFYTKFLYDRIRALEGVQNRNRANPYFDSKLYEEAKEPMEEIKYDFNDEEVATEYTVEEEALIPKSSKLSIIGSS